MNIIKSHLKDDENKEQDHLVKLYKTLPNDFGAEKILLGTILYSASMGSIELEKAIGHIENITTSDEFGRHFYTQIHNKIYELILLNYKKGRPISTQSLAPSLSKEVFFQDDIVMAKNHLDKLILDAGLINQIEELTKRVLDLSIKRQIIGLSIKTVNDVINDEELLHYSEYINEIEKNLASLVIHGEYNRDSVNLSSLINAVSEKIKMNMENPNELNGLNTGFTQLNNLTGGLQNSDLIILAARPAMGKTALALCLAMNIAEYLRDSVSEDKKGSVGFISLEMSGEQLTSRLISVKSKVNSQKMTRGGIDQNEYESIIRACNNLRTLNFTIDDNAALTITGLKSKARKMAVKNNLKVLFVDYLQLLHGDKKNSNNRVEEVSEISRGLKEIAKELNIPVIALSQLSRKLEDREDKVPKLSDLRESGSIEQDADIVMFLYREEYYLKAKNPRKNEDGITYSFGKNFSKIDSNENNDYQDGLSSINDSMHDEEDEKMDQWQKAMDSCAGKAKLYIEKHRSGPTGDVFLRFDSSTTTFIDPEQYSEENFFNEDNGFG
jgi:replicative DNA helicase